MVAALQATGFRVIPEATKADIFVGHSGGCLLTPSNHTARLVVFVGIPYSPKKSVIATLIRKNIQEERLSRVNHQRKQWLIKFMWHGVYFWRMDRNIAMSLRVSQGPQTLSSAQTLCIRNKDDDFCTDLIWQLPTLKDAAFLSLPGSHDDLWVHPEAYAGIIKAYYGANVLA